MSVQIVVSGIATLDILIRPLLPYNSSGKRKLHSVSYAPGGNAANTAYFLAALGLKVRFLGFFGNDWMARMVKADFRRWSIDLRGSRTLRAPHCCSFVRREQSGESFIDGYVPPALEQETIDLDRDLLKGVSAIYVDNHFPALAYKLAAEAQRRHIPVIADLENITAETLRVLKHVDVLIAPRAIILDLGQKSRIDLALHTLTASRFTTVVATEGEAGSIGLERGLSDLIVVKARKVAAKDTTGAGDAYHAAFLYAMVKGHDLKRAMEFASRAASEKCRHEGPRLPLEAVASLSERLGPALSLASRARKPTAITARQC